MRVLVTGAAGFVGLHLVRGLLRSIPQVEVLATDLGGGGGWEAGVAWRDLDVTRRDQVTDAMATFRPEVVIHGAALTPTAAEEVAQAQRIAAINVGGAFTVVDVAMRQPGVRRVIVLSSIAALGPGLRDGPVTEDAVPDPQTLYGTTKLVMETVVARLARLHGVEAVIVRLTSVYGDMERANASRPVTSHVDRIARAVSPVRPEGGDVVRDWIHADDAALAVAALATKPRLGHGLYHLGGGEAVGWHRLTAALRDAGCAVGEHGEPMEMRASDARPVLCIDRLVAEIGFRPRGIEQGARDLMRAIQA